MAGLDELFPNGGFLDTGLKMWGLNGAKKSSSRIHHQGVQQTPPALIDNPFPVRNTPVPMPSLAAINSMPRLQRHWTFAAKNVENLRPQGSA